MQIEDSTICTLLNRHDTKGMEYLFERYYKPLVLWSSSFLHSLPQAEDLVQDFFIRLWERERRTFLQPQTFRSFLYTSVRNLALDRIEKKDPLRNASQLHTLDRTWEEYDMLEDELLNRIKGEIEKLPARSREIIQCVYLEGMPYKETAQKLGISVSTVNTLLVHALKKIRQLYPGLDKKTILFLLLSKREFENEVREIVEKI